MPKKKQPEAPKPKPRGPQPEVLKIEGDWQEAVKTSFEKKKPVSGWPKDK